MEKKTEEEALQFIKSRDQFRNYKDINEYIEDIIICLIYSPWRYTEERARECVDYRMKYIIDAYDRKESAYDCSAEVGWHAG